MVKKATDIQWLLNYYLNLFNEFYKLLIETCTWMNYINTLRLMIIL